MDMTARVDGVLWKEVSMGNLLAELHGTGLEVRHLSLDLMQWAVGSPCRFGDVIEGSLTKRCVLVGVIRGGASSGTREVW